MPLSVSALAAPPRHDERPPALELKALAHTRGERRLFYNLNATVRAGALLRVQGANGAGKTSLLRLVCGLSRPEAGEVRWQGRAIDADPAEFRRRLVYLADAPALKDHLSAAENLVSASALAGSAVLAAEAARALADAGLDGCAHVPVRRLSRGQRKRAALARLLLGAGAPLWVLDEPFNALDEAANGWLRETIAAHLGKGGVVVLTSHQNVPLPDHLPQVSLAL